jgi:hypothetical protein
MDKSQWDTVDWREWLDTQSDYAVVAELKWQFDRITELRKLVQEIYDIVDLFGIVVLRPRLKEILSRPEVQGIMKEVEDETV